MRGGESAAVVSAGRPQRRPKREDLHDIKVDDEKQEHKVDGQAAYEVKGIEGTRLKSNKVEYLVRWKDFNYTEWVPRPNCKVAASELINEYNKRQRERPAT